MGQDQGGAAGHQAVERLLDHRLVLGIDRGQRFVQHQDRGIAQQGAGDGDALPLAAGQARAALADHGLVAVGQRGDEAVGVGGARGGDQLGFRGVRAAETQVVLDGAVEQVGVLRDDRNHLAQRVGIERAQVAPADADRAPLRVVQPQQQAHDRGFPRSAGSDDADALAGRDVERQALMRRAAAAGIGEADVVEGDAGGDGWGAGCDGCGVGREVGGIGREIGGVEREVGVAWRQAVATLPRHGGRRPAIHDFPS